MKGVILAALLAALPVHALADGQKAPSCYSRMSSKLGLCCGPTDCGHLWSNKYIKGNAAEGYWIWHADQWYAVDPNAIVGMDSPDGKIHYCFQNGEIICVVLPATTPVVTTKPRRLGTTRTGMLIFARRSCLRRSLA